MKKLTILVGPPGVGKTSYIKDEEALVLSSDAIREEYPDYTHTQVFEHMRKLIMENETFDTVYHDATNMSRRKRAHLYREVKRKGYTVEIVVLFDLYYSIIGRLEERNENIERKVPTSVVIDMLKRFQAPRVGVDCDCYSVHKPSALDHFKYEDYLMCHSDVEHESVHHIETVKEHLKNAEMIASDEYKVAAKWHDFGKLLTKEGHKFYGHANVSAYFMLGAGESESDIALVEDHMNDGSPLHTIDELARIKFHTNPFVTEKKGDYFINHTGYEMSSMYKLAQSNLDTKKIRNILKYRSAAYDKQGRLVGLGLPKFFNVLETGNALSIPVGVCKYYRKLDGTLIMVSKDRRDNLLVRTRASVDGEYVEKALKYINSNDIELINNLKQGKTLCFEMIGTDNKHVIDYGGIDLELVHLCTVGHETGYIYMNPELEIRSTHVGGYMNLDNVEGLVIKDAEGNLFKMKTEAFVRAHKAPHVTAPKRIAQLIDSGNVDDVMMNLPNQTQEVINKVFELVEWYKEACGELEDVEQSEIFTNDKYIEYRKHFKQIKIIKDGTKPDYLFWRKAVSHVMGDNQ